MVVVVIGNFIVKSSMLCYCIPISNRCYVVAINNCMAVGRNATQLFSNNDNRTDFNASDDDEDITHSKTS